MISLVLLYLCWCVLHSLLITDKINAFLRRRDGFAYGAYRLAYSLFSLVTLLPLVLYQYSLPSQVLFSWQGGWRIAQGILLLYAIIMFHGGYRVYDLRLLMGFSQWRNYRQGLKNSAPTFSCQGALCYVRHPWYSAGLPLLWANGPITDTTLPVRIILSLYLVIGALLEEQKLIKEFGQAYLRYREQVPMLIPWRGKVRIQLRHGERSSGSSIY